MQFIRMITPKSNKIQILLLDPQNNVYNAFRGWESIFKQSKWHNLILMSESKGFLHTTKLLSSNLCRRFSRGILLLFQFPFRALLTKLSRKKK